MPLSTTLFILRGVIAVVLYLFLGLLLLYIWRDVRAAAPVQRETSRRTNGSLLVMESELPDVPLGHSFDLLPLTTIGRGVTNSIVLADTFCSTYHAHIGWRQGQWWLEDQDSRNGTELNQTLITKPVVLSTGDVIAIGRVQLRVELE